MTRISQATKLEAIEKILDGVQHPNTVYIWLDQTYKDSELVLQDILDCCNPEGQYFGPQLKPNFPKINKREHTLYFDNGSEIWFRSANNPCHLRGFRVHGVVSSTDINDDALVSAQTCLTQTQGWLVLLNDTRTDSERAVG